MCFESLPHLFTTYYIRAHTSLLHTTPLCLSLYHTSLLDTTYEHTPLYYILHTSLRSRQLYCKADSFCWRTAAQYWCTSTLQPYYYICALILLYMSSYYSLFASTLLAPRCLYYYTWCFFVAGCCYTTGARCSTTRGADWYATILLLEGLLPDSTDTHTHTHTSIDRYVCRERA